MHIPMQPTHRLKVKYASFTLNRTSLAKPRAEIVSIGMKLYQIEGTTKVSSGKTYNQSFHCWGRSSIPDNPLLRTRQWNDGRRLLWREDNRSTTNTEAGSQRSYGAIHRNLFWTNHAPLIPTTKRSGQSALQDQTPEVSLRIYTTKNHQNAKTWSAKSTYFFVDYDESHHEKYTADKAKWNGKHKVSQRIHHQAELYSVEELSDWRSRL